MTELPQASTMPHGQRKRICNNPAFGYKIQYSITIIIIITIINYYYYYYNAQKHNQAISCPQNLTGELADLCLLSSITYSFIRIRFRNRLRNRLLLFRSAVAVSVPGKNRIRSYLNG